MPTSSTAPPLSAQHQRALYDLLIHQHTYYSECVRFNQPSGITDYGPPFDDAHTAAPSKSPILQTLLHRFILPLPGVRSFSPAFWTNVRTLLRQFAAANLSDSYDHAGLGLRRTLATGSAALLEYPGRAVFEGLARGEVMQKKEKEESRKYDVDDPEDLNEAWHVLLHGAVYGDAIDDLFDRVKETDKLTDHTTLVQAAHEFILLHLASVIHYIFVESPDALYVQKLTSNILKLLPWTMIRQSLRYGNAATMINAMTKLFLTKLSITSFTNWMGWSNNPDDGMNLLQQIVSTLIGWDIAEYQKKLARIKKSDFAPSHEHLEKLDAYHSLKASETERLRGLSQKKEMSIVTVIFQDSSLTILEDEAHTLAIEYLALCASMHDREAISKIICHSHPDLITASIREGVTAYDPIFRAIHNAVDLSATCVDLENFLAEFMALFDSTPPRRSGASTPRATDDSQLNKAAISVDQVANVLRKHQGALHKFTHQIVSQGGHIADDYRNYAKAAAAQFRRTQSSASSASSSSQKPIPATDNDQPIGAMTPHLTSLFTSLSKPDQTAVQESLDLYTAYLSALSSVTTDRLHASLLDSSTNHNSNHNHNNHNHNRSSSPPSPSSVSAAPPSAGPGTFLARWQHLLDASPTTPTSPRGKVRYGAARLADADGEADKLGHNVTEPWKWPEMPNVQRVVSLLSDAFAVLLGELGRDKWRDDLGERVD